MKNKVDHDWTVIRWHQTADIGYVPNGKMPNTFMAVAPDTYDRIENKLRGGIHPRNKQTPSLRLAIAGFNVAYGFINYPTRGPWPMSVKISGKYFITNILQPVADLRRRPEGAMPPPEEGKSN